MKFKKATLTTFAATAALALTACGGGGSAGNGSVSGSWSDIVAAAKKEGRVTLYSSQNPKNQEALKQAFQKKYPGIKMDFVRGIDADNATKIEAEKQTGRGTADVYVTATGSWIHDTATPGSYAVEIKGPDFDNAAYNRAKTVTDDRYFLVGAAVLGIGWNTDQFPEGLKGYKDLLNPKLTGKIGITGPTSGSYTDFYKFIERTQGADFLPALAKLKPRIYPGTLPIGQALTSGELAAAIVVNPLINEKKSGAPVDWVLPDPAWGARWNGMVLKSAPHPNAAEVLADFMVSQDGQVAGSATYGSALPDIPGAIKNAQDVPVQDLKLQTATAVADYLKEWDTMFK